MSVKSERRLNNLTTRLENATKKALIIAGNLVADGARERVHVISGDLEASIQRGNPYLTGEGVAIDISAGMPYAAEEEYRPGSKHGTPHAYMRPALTAAMPEIVALLGKEVVTSIKGR